MHSGHSGIDYSSCVAAAFFLWQNRAPCVQLRRQTHVESEYCHGFREGNNKLAQEKQPRLSLIMSDDTDSPPEREMKVRRSPQAVLTS